MIHRSDDLVVLAATAEANPDRVAVIDEAGSIAYGALAATARRVGASLTAAGIGKGHRVAILGSRNAATVAAIHGVLATGAAYVPLDPDWPAARMRAVCSDGAVTALVGDSDECIEKRIADRATLVDVRRAEMNVLGEPTAPWPSIHLERTDPAYLLYTSGSTGTPKGVLISHGAGRAFVEWAIAEFGVTGSDVLAGTAPFSFDLSTFDLFASAAVGATLLLVPSYLASFPSDLARFIAEHQATVWYSVPYPLVRLGELGSRGADLLRTLRLVLFAGEPFPPPQLGQLMNMTPAAQHVNLYGPTETNVCTFWRVPNPPEPTVPIGRPIEPDACYVMVGDRPVCDEVGCVGELWVAGLTLADGYWHRPEETAARFVPLPNETGERAYRTGDVVRIVAPNTFEYLGRRDRLVKVRGVRIELGEVEHAALATSGVAEASALALPDAHLGTQIYLLVAPREASVSGVLRECRRRLPAVAVPREVWTVEALPRNYNGKTDRPVVLSIVERLRGGGPANTDDR